MTPVVGLAFTAVIIAIGALVWAIEKLEKRIRRVEENAHVFDPVPMQHRDRLDVSL